MPGKNNYPTHRLQLGDVIPLTSGKTKATFAAGRPQLLKTLNAAERTKAKWLSRLLSDRGAATPGDGVLISQLAVALVRWEQCKAEIDRDGLFVMVTVLDHNGAPFERRVANPALKIQEATEKHIHALAKSLGMSPTDRDRMKTLTPPVGTKTEPRPGTIGFFKKYGYPKEEENEDVEPPDTIDD